MFKVGQEVVCIEDNWISPPNIVPKEGGIYKITAIKNQLLEFSSLLPLWGWAYVNFRALDYDFVEEVIKQVEPKEELV